MAIAEKPCMSSLRITLIGGPTALIEFGGFRLLTDPTFDAPGEYRLPHVTLKKTSYPAIAADAIGLVDAVLLSHDQHSDNLDNSGRAFLAKVARVLTTATYLGAMLSGLMIGLREGWSRWLSLAVLVPSVLITVLGGGDRICPCLPG